MRRHHLRALEEGVTLDEDAGATVDDLVGEAVLLDVLLDVLVVRARLQPDVRHAESLDILEEAEGDLRNRWRQMLPCKAEKRRTLGPVTTLTEVWVGSGRSARARTVA